MISIGMSTSCNFPMGVEQSFRLARLAGYDGIEVMITSDPVTRDAAALRALIERYSMPILSIHAPSLFLTQFVWGRDAQVKLERSAQLAADVGASAVVVHPPFRWEAGYARNFERAGFADEVAEIRQRHAARDREGALAAVSDRMVDAIDVMGDAAHVHATVQAYVDGGVQVPVVMPLPWGADRMGTVRRTMEAAAGVGV